MRDSFDFQNETGEPEETLRLVAELPPPAGIEERVQLRLEQGLERRLEPELTASTRRGFWGLWLPSHRLQFAGAAVLVLAFAGSMWSVHHAKSGAAPVVQTPTATPGPAFGSAGAERHPSTLKPIKVPPPAPKKKPSASRFAAKHAAKPTAAAEQGSLNTPATQ